MFMGFSWRGLQWSFSRGWEFRGACGRPLGIEKIRSSPEIQILSISIRTLNQGVLFIQSLSLRWWAMPSRERESKSFCWKNRWLSVSRKNRWLSVSPALCQGRLVGFSYIWNMCLSIKSEMSLTYFGARLQPSRFGFFGLPDWPGLAPALAQRPVTKADVDLWGRANVLWQGGQHFGCKKWLDLA